MRDSAKGVKTDKAAQAKAQQTLMKWLSIDSDAPAKGTFRDPMKGM